jgi:hypothetical protein
MAIGDPRTQIDVICYSGFKGDERPVRFRLGDVDYFVEEIVEQWYGPEAAFFKVRADDGGIYVLQQQRGMDGGGAWSLESHRRESE